MPKLAATFDIETTGLEAKFGRVVCAVIKPWGQEEELYHLDKIGSDDSQLVATIINELSQYAILIAHNGVMFDVRFLNGRAVAYGLPVISPFQKVMDPVWIARKHLNLERNSLDAIAQHLKLDEGKMHLAPEVWVRAALDDDEEAKELLYERCRSDVRILEIIAAEFLPLTRQIGPWGSA